MRGGDGERAALAARHGLADTAVHSTNRTMVHILFDAFDDGGTDHACEMFEFINYCKYCAIPSSMTH
jgi:hypothetical protein